MLQWETKPIKLAEGDIVNHQFVQMQHFQESVICSKKGVPATYRTTYPQSRMRLGSRQAALMQKHERSVGAALKSGCADMGAGG